MERKLLMSCFGSAIALCLSTFAAAAAPSHFGLAQQQHAAQNNLVIPARMMGMPMGHMSMGHMGHMGHIGHIGPMGPRHAFGHRFYGHGSLHHHRHSRFFFVGVPYYDYYDDYPGDCWWSPRYHRWICADY
ncbi:hypothetical protein [Hyphomicrobium denitrificans]|nr:hypothetical protein [Hyphomicrobium denitrificans]